MKNFRRKMKKNTRAKTFDELEKAFFDLAQKHNILYNSHRRLEQKLKNLNRDIADNQPKYYT